MFVFYYWKVLWKDLLFPSLIVNWRSYFSINYFERPGVLKILLNHFWVLYFDLYGKNYQDHI